MDEPHLQELIEEATMDCYDEEEAFWGFHAMLADQLPFPFSAMVLGEAVQITDLAQKSNLRRGMLVELEKGGQKYVFPLAELDTEALEEDAATWVATFQLWSQ